jgi:hypothetical protein
MGSPVAIFLWHYFIIKFLDNQQPDCDDVHH